MRHNICPLAAEDRSQQLGLLGTKEANFENKIKSERPRTFNVVEVEVTLPLPRRIHQKATVTAVVPHDQQCHSGPPQSQGEQKKLLSRRVIYLNDDSQKNNFDNCEFHSPWFV